MKITTEFAMMTEENHEKTQSDWTPTEFKLGTSRIRIQRITTAPPSSVTSLISYVAWAARQVT